MSARTATAVRRALAEAAALRGDDRPEYRTLLRHTQAAEPGIPTDYGGHPLQYLALALEWGRPEVFVDYLAWAGEVVSRRGYRVADLMADLREWAAFYRARLSPEAAESAAGLLAEGERALEQGRAPSDAYLHSGVPEAPEAVAFLGHILDGDSARAQALFDQVAARDGGPARAAVRLVQPAMYEVGLLWQRNRINVAREHLATGVAQGVLAAACADPPAEALHGRLLLACCAYNEHALGLRLLGAAFREAGWAVQNLGPNLPVPDLVAYAADWQPDLVGLSVSLPVHLPAAREAVLALRGEFGARCPATMVGGLPTNLAGDGWRITGADLWAPNAMVAVEAATA
jgi:methanogenic corrinoid protein MtbC1